MKNNLIKCLLLSFTFLPLASYALDSDNQQPCYIQSIQAIRNSHTHLTTYIKQVHVRQGTTRLRGDKMIVQRTTDGKIKEIILYGHLAHYQTLPKLHSHTLYARAEVIYYFPAQQKVLLLRNARIKQQQNTFHGQKIWYNIQKQTILSKKSSGKKKSTVIIIQAQQSKDKTLS